MQITLTHKKKFSWRSLLISIKYNGCVSLSALSPWTLRRRTSLPRSLWSYRHDEQQTWKRSRLRMTGYLPCLCPSWQTLQGQLNIKLSRIAQLISTLICYPTAYWGGGRCLKSVCFQEESPGGATALLILNVFLVLTEKIPGIEPDFPSSCQTFSMPWL